MLALHVHCPASKIDTVPYSILDCSYALLASPFSGSWCKSIKQDLSRKCSAWKAFVFRLSFWSLNPQPPVRGLSMVGGVGKGGGGEVPVVHSLALE